jgi:hypothetical protein
MSSDAGTGAPADGGQAGTDTTTSTATDGSGAAVTGTGTTTTTTTDDWGSAEWKAFAAETGLSVTELKKKLDHSRTWEQRAKENKGAADQAKTLQEQVEELKQEQAARDERDAKRAERLALADVRSGLADAGIKADDVKELLDEIDPKRLLKDGDPDEKAIARIVGALRKAAGRPTPDPDQGKTGSRTPSDMNALIRRAAGVG